MVISPHKEQHRVYVTPLCGVTYTRPFLTFNPLETVTFIKLACAKLEQNNPLETHYVFLSNFSSRYPCCRIFHLPSPVFETAKVKNQPLLTCRQTSLIGKCSEALKSVLSPFFDSNLTSPRFLAKHASNIHLDPLALILTSHFCQTVAKQHAFKPNSNSKHRLTAGGKANPSGSFLRSRPCQRQEMARHSWGDAGNERSEGKGWRGASPQRRVLTSKIQKKLSYPQTFPFLIRSFLFFIVLSCFQRLWRHWY